MQGLPLVLLFVALTFISWGAYGPVLHHGTQSMGNDSLRAFVGVGLAYFIIAVIVPIIILRRQSEKGNWTFVGTAYSIVAGAVGAIGALGVILALAYKGKPVYVMPLVFGFAPIVNTLVTAWMGKAFSQIKPIFFAGIVAASLGAGGVLAFKPSVVSHATANLVPQPQAQPETAVQAPEPSLIESTIPLTPNEPTQLPPPVVNPAPLLQDASVNAPEKSASQFEPSQLRTMKYVSAVSDDRSATTSPATIRSPSAVAASNGSNVWKIVCSIIMAAFCWGAYGPMLHQGQARMGGSRWRPFICVGLAYFLIAVAAPMYLINTGNSTGSWTISGLGWSIAAGAAGAIGALGIILAFNAGGKPFYVMPLVFGFAPVINTFITLTESGLWSEVKPLFWASLAVVIAGAITVLINAPKPQQSHNGHAGATRPQPTPSINA